MSVHLKYTTHARLKITWPVHHSDFNTTFIGKNLYYPPHILYLMYKPSLCQLHFYNINYKYNIFFFILLILKPGFYGH